MWSGSVIQAINQASLIRSKIERATAGVTSPTRPVIEYVLEVCQPVPHQLNNSGKRRSNTVKPRTPHFAAITPNWTRHDSQMNETRWKMYLWFKRSSNSFPTPYSGLVNPVNASTQLARLLYQCTPGRRPRLVFRWQWYKRKLYKLPQRWERR